MLIVAHILNNSLGNTVQVPTWEDGIDKIIEMAEADGYRFDDKDAARKQIEDDQYSLLRDDDPENIHSYSVGVVETS